MNIPQFIAKWRQVQLTERSASQQHFLDLCSVLQHPTPAEADPLGEWFTFEKGAEKHGGGQGWADVWKRGFFGWEYKGKHKDLVAAYDQLLKYREALENPPLLIVCDMDRFEIHTNFTATVSKTHLISLDDVDTPRNIEIMRNVFFDPAKLRPDATSKAITQEVAQRVAQIAQGLRTRGLDAMDVARFLDRIVFCLFAEDVGLLPRKLFSKLVEKSRDPSHFGKLVGQLFEAMNSGGDFGVDTIRHFNGNLFIEGPVLELTAAEISHVRAAARLDWSAVDPSIFGTLFQRGLDPDTRAQLGAQYTSREDIEALIEPVVLQPLRIEWAEIRDTIQNLLNTGRAQPTNIEREKPLTKEMANRGHKGARTMLRAFLERLAHLKVLDPACGSGNFLYVTLQKLKDLEKEVLIYANVNRLGSFFGQVGPWQFYGIEINPYAFELAQTTLWIGYLQWIHANGFGVPAEPILREMDNFRNMDGVVDLSDPKNPKEPEWPEADFIVGNPPFLGNRFIAGEIGREYVKALAKIYQKRLGGKPDLVCYFFEKARKAIAEGRSKRAGLLATQGIRGGTNRNVLKRIKDTGDIFFAESDRDWILDGANVHISMIGFDDGSEVNKTLDGQPVTTINANLTSGSDTTQALALKENLAIGFQGAIARGPFDIADDLAQIMLGSAGNPNSKPNSDVLLPYVNAFDLTRRNRNVWIIDFKNRTALEDVTSYVQPFEHLRATFSSESIEGKDGRVLWWLHWRQRAEMLEALKPLPRFIATPALSKHRLFVWLEAPVYPDHALILFARSDDYFFGVLQSRLHEVWSLKLGTRLETRPRYTPTTSFETFPLPEASEEHITAIGAAARELDGLRRQWLNPLEWTREEVLEFPGSTDGPWARFLVDADSRGVGTVRCPRLVPKDDKAAQQLAKRTLTTLYNERPTWLELAHAKLDEMVCAAYGWESDMSEEAILSRLLQLNMKRQDEV